MACMSHSCACGYEWFDNQAWGDCPECGSSYVSHHFDEEPDDERNDFDEYDDLSDLDDYDWEADDDPA